MVMRTIVKEVEDLKRFLHRTEYFIRNGCENLHPDTLKYYIKALKVRLDKIECGKVLESDEVYLFRTRITSCEQYLNVRVESSPKALSSKISRTADLESRELLLRGSAQRESRQREDLLRSKAQKSKNQEQHLTLRQRRLLLLENDEQNPNDAKSMAEAEKEAQDLAKQTLELTRSLKEQALGTKSIVGEDNKLLENIDQSMEKNLGNLKRATENVEEILNASGSSQYCLLLMVFIVWIIMVVIITTVPKLN